MSIPVDLTELGEAVGRYGFGYLVTPGADGHAHVVAVRPQVGEREIVVADLGRRSMANAASSPLVTLVWPPQDPGGYSLIVDGRAVPDTESDSVSIRPTRAVLHRPAPAPDEAPDGTCVSDCVELPLAAEV